MPDEHAEKESKRQEQQKTGVSPREPTQHDLMRKDLPKKDVSQAVEDFDGDEA